VNSTISSTILQEVTQNFGVTLRTAVEASGGFSGALVLRITSDDGSQYALRWTPPASAQPVERMLALHRLQSCVNLSGLTAIPVPLACCRPHDARGISGSPIITDHSREISTELSKPVKSGEPWTVLLSDAPETVPQSPSQQSPSQKSAVYGFWQMEPWMRGKSVSGNELTQMRLHHAAHALCQFHTAAAEYSGLRAASEYFYTGLGVSPAVIRRLQIVEHLNGGRLQELTRSAAADTDSEYRQITLPVCETLKKFLPQLETQLRRLSVVSFALQPVLRDVWSAHVLFTGDEVTGLIDLSACGTDHIAVDLSRLQRSWFGNDTSGIASFIRQYEIWRRLTRDEQLLLKTLDACTVILSPVTWLQRIYPDDAHGISQGDGPSQGQTAPRLNVRTDAVLQRLRQLKETLIAWRPL
jgi:hypothetical protein